MSFFHFTSKNLQISRSTTPATTSRPVTGVARITATTLQIITGVARITVSTLKTISGVSRITGITSQLINGVARITATTLQTIQGVARIAITTLQTIPGLSRIQISTLQTINGVARITATTLKTITGVARITVSTLKTIPGVSRITATTQKTITGVARIQQTVLAVAGKAIKFNGSTDYVTVTDAASIRPETNNAYSVAFDVKLDSYNNNVLPRIFEKNAQYVCIMGDNTNGRYRNIGLAVTDASGTEHEFWGGTQLQLNTLYRVVITFDGTLSSNQAQIYINNVAETVTPIFPWGSGNTMQTTSGQNLFLARRHTDQARNLQGTLDNFMMWTRVLTSTEIGNLYTEAGIATGPGIVLLMDEGTGTTLNDSSGNSNTGTLTNGAWVNGLSPQSIIGLARITVSTLKTIMGVANISGGVTSLQRVQAYIIG